MAVVRDLISTGRPGAAVEGTSAPWELADVGSGAGVPGLVLAQELPDVSVTLVERRRGRASWLEEAAAALAVEGVSVRVCGADVYDLARGEARGRYDLVTARAFGRPSVTAELAGALVAIGGYLVVSEPPDQPDRWDAVDLSALGLADLGPSGGPGMAGRRTGPTSARARFRVLVRDAALAAPRPRRRPRP